MSKTEKQKVGEWGEGQASLFLIQKGYDIVDRNFQIREGEIDIIAWQSKYHFGRTLCFVEVKTRSYGEGSAERATGKKKQLRLFRAAREYCLQNNIDVDQTPIQFEQVSVYAKSNSSVPRIKHYIIPID